LGLAAAVREAAGTPASPALWLGAIVASGAPDLDLIGTIFGARACRVHRHATHSLLVLGGLVLMAAWAWPLLPGGLEAGIGVAWAAALLSHPLLDLATTGPATAARGFGIALLWPVVSRRWFLRRPLFAAGELTECQSLREAWTALRPEVCLLAPTSMLIILLGRLF
jgi:membrane-bound metal-dependent hydrolase YbcI (DUF457 family)